MARTVELVVEGAFESAKIAAGFDDVGSAATDCANDVDRASRDMDQSADRMGSVADAADGMGSSASQAAGGLGDLGGALSNMGGPLGGVGAGMETLAPLVMGVTGATDLLNLAMNSNIVTSVRQAVTTAASTTASIAASAASKAWAATQWLLNAALSANPIGLVVIAVAALVGGIILAYQKSETFRNIVDAAMDVVHAAFDKVVGIVTDIPGFIQDVIDKAGFLAPAFETAKTLIVGYFDLITLPLRTVIDLVQELIDWIGKIDFPNIPDLNPLNGRTASGRSSTGSGFGIRSTGSPSGVTINVPAGFVGDEDKLARVIGRMLDSRGRRLGPT